MILAEELGLVLATASTVVVRVERSGKPGRVQFEIEKPDESCARGVLDLAEGSPP